MRDDLVQRRSVRRCGDRRTEHRTRPSRLGPSGTASAITSRRVERRAGPDRGRCRSTGPRPTRAPRSRRGGTRSPARRRTSWSCSAPAARTRVRHPVLGEGGEHPLGAPSRTPRPGRPRHRTSQAARSAPLPDGRGGEPVVLRGHVREQVAKRPLDTRRRSVEIAEVAWATTAALASTARRSSSTTSVFWAASFILMRLSSVGTYRQSSRIDNSHVRRPGGPRVAPRCTPSCSRLDTEGMSIHRRRQLDQAARRPAALVLAVAVTVISLAGCGASADPGPSGTSAKPTKFTAEERAGHNQTSTSTSPR